MFILRSYKNRGLSGEYLQSIFHALIISRLLYALSVWGGFCNSNDESKINKMLRKCKRYGYTNEDIKFSQLLDISDGKLFLKAQSQGHPLHSLLPVREVLPSLRPRGHPYSLPL